MVDPQGIVETAAPIAFRASKHVVEYALQRDDLYRFLKLAAGGLDELRDEELDELRRAIGGVDFWTAMYDPGTDSLDSNLFEQVRPCLRSGDWGDTAAHYIVRRLLEIGLAHTRPPLFAKVIDARIARLATNQAEQFRRLDEALMIAHAGLYDSVISEKDELQRVKSLLHRVLDALPSDDPASVADVLRYLDCLVDDLNRDPWPHDTETEGPVLRPTDLERTLRLRRVDDGTPRLAAPESADEIAEQAQHLVILGGPGAGKTWFARRVARRTAIKAAEGLRSGLGIEDVELPLYSTCEHFLNASGSPREAAVKASVDTRSDLGPRVPHRLRSLFGERTHQVLLVLDALDEASGATKPFDHALISGWRVMTTSRPGSWTDQWGRPEDDERLTVGTLEPLTYPWDVERFIATWFKHSPAAGRSLRSNLKSRRRHQQWATVPLLLTFMCLIGRRGQLPRSRRELFEQVLHRLLEMGWRHTPAQETEADGRLIDTARQWAWSAATNEPFSGLGAWSETFQAHLPPAGLAPEDLQRLDTVAVKVGPKDPGLRTVPRRFVHRAIREHLVAQHLCSLPRDDAVQALLPHLWFDTTWDEIVPVAIGMHPLRDELLRSLLAECPAHLADEPHRIAARQVETSLLALAEETSPEEWDESNRAMLHGLRRQRALTETRLVANSAHWTDSNAAARAQLVSALPKADEWSLHQLLAGLVALAPTEEDRPAIRGELVAALRTAKRAQLPSLLSTLVMLEPTEDEQFAARADLLANLGDLSPERPRSLLDLVGILVLLDPTEEDCQAARGHMLATLPEAGPGLLPALLERLLALQPTEQDLESARGHVLATLPEARPGQLPALLEKLLALQPTEQDRRNACGHLLATIPCSDSGHRPDLLQALTALTSTQQDREDVRAQLLGSLPDTSPERLAGVVATLMALEPTEHEQLEVRARLLPAINRADPWVQPGLLEGLIAVTSTEQDREAARAELLAILPNTDPQCVRGVLAALVALQPTELECQRARTYVFSRLTATHREHLPALLTVLLSLNPTSEDRATARAQLISAIPQATQQLVPALLRTFGALASTERDRHAARAELLAILPNTPRTQLPELLDTLVQLKPTEQDRQAARAYLLTNLSSTDLTRLGGLLRALLSLEPSEEERSDACALVLCVLPSADQRQLLALLKTLVALEPTEQDLETAREQLLAALPDTDPDLRTGLLLTLVVLTSTEQDRQAARAELLAILPNTPRTQLPELLKTLVQLTSTEQDRHAARAELLAILPNTPRTQLPELLDTLVQLKPTEQDRQAARAELLAILPNTPRTQLPQLLRALVQLKPTEQDRQAAIPHLLATLSESDPRRLPELLQTLAALEPAGQDRETVRVHLLALLAEGGSQPIPELVAGTQAVLEHPGMGPVGHRGLAANQPCSHPCTGALTPACCGTPTWTPTHPGMSGVSRPGESGDSVLTPRRVTERLTSVVC